MKSKKIIFAETLLLSVLFATSAHASFYANTIKSYCYTKDLVGMMPKAECISNARFNAGVYKEIIATLKPFKKGDPRNSNPQAMVEKKKSDLAQIADLKKRLSRQLGSADSLAPVLAPNLSDTLVAAEQAVKTNDQGKKLALISQAIAELNTFQVEMAE